MKKTKNNKGVTLLALVVTIIIILILGTILLTSFNNGKLIDKTKDAVLQTELKNTEEALKLSYQRNENGTVNFERTKSAMEEVLGKFDDYTIRDSDDFPITIFVPAKYDNKVYRYVANRNGTITSDILDEIVETGVSDIYVAWDEDTDNGEPTGKLDATVIIKTANITPNYTESDAVDALNCFFEMQYDAYTMLNYINDNYIKVHSSNDTLESWINGLTNDEDIREDITGFVNTIQAFNMKFPVEDSSGNEEQSEGKSLLEIATEEHLFANAQNQAYTFSSLDDIFTFLNAHKLGYFKVFKIVDNMSGSSSSEESEQIFNFIETTLKQKDISSLDNLVNAAKSVDLTQIGMQSETEDVIKAVADKFEANRMRKAMSMGLIFGEAMAKATIGGEIEFLGLIDSTVKSYTDKYAAMANSITSNPLDALILAGKNNIAEYMGKTLNFNGTEIEVDEDLFIDGSGNSEDEMYIWAALGIIPVNIRNANIDKNSTDKITISFDNYSNSKTINGWDILN